MNRLVSFLKWAFASWDREDIIVAIPEKPGIKCEAGTGSQRNFLNGKYGIPVDLARIDVYNSRTSDWVLDDNTEPIQYGANGEYMICFLKWRTYWFAVDIRNESGHNFYAFDIREIAKEADMAKPGEDEDIIFDKRKWLIRFLGELEMKEYFLDFRINDVNRKNKSL